MYKSVFSYLERIQNYTKIIIPVLGNNFILYTRGLKSDGKQLFVEKMYTVNKLFLFLKWLKFLHLGNKCSIGYFLNY